MLIANEYRFTWKLLLLLELLVTQMAVGNGFLVDSSHTNSSVVAGSQADALALMNGMWSNLTAEITTLRQSLEQERLKRDNLQRDLESKNDEIFFLKTSMVSLNQSIQHQLQGNVNHLSAVDQNSIRQLNSSILALGISGAEDLDKMTRLVKEESGHLMAQVKLLNSSIETEKLRRNFEDNKLDQAIQRAASQHTSDYNYVLSSTASDLNSVSQKVNDLQTNISTVSQGGHQRRVLFTAGSPSTSANNTGAIIFKVVDPNLGSSYNTNTGIFTCPVAGVYFFIYHLAALGDFLECSLVHNGINVARTAALTVEKNGFTSTVNAVGSSSTLLHMQTGDTLYLGFCATNTKLLSTSSLSGVLLFED